MVSEFKKKLQDKRFKRKFLSILQLVIICVVSFPLEIADIIFMFTEPKINQGLLNTLSYQHEVYHHYEGEFAFQWISLVLASLVIFLGGLSFFKNAFNETFKWRRWGMSTLITLSVFVSYFFSFYPLIQNSIWMAQLNEGKLAIESTMVSTGMLSSFFPTAAIVITIAMIGQYITTSLKLKANDDLTELSSLQVLEAYLKAGAEVKKVKTKDLKVGDVVVVYKNTLIPIDGKLLSEYANVNESTITGESKPILKKKNDQLIGSTTNLGETFEMQVTSTSKDSIVAGIIKNVKKIQSQKPKYQKLADRISFWFIPTIIVISIITFFLHAFVPDFNEALHNYAWATNPHKEVWEHGPLKYITAVYSAIAILVVACPCALGLAVPLALVISSSRSAKNGVLINHADAYEKIKKIDTIAFDKTGTLTKGQFVVSGFEASKEQLQILYELELKSIHPLAKSYKDFYEEQDFKLPPLDLSDWEINEIPGLGMKAIDKKHNVEYLATSLKHARQENFEISDNIKDFIAKHDEEDTLTSFVVLVENKKVQAIVSFNDDLNQNAADTIKLFQNDGIKIVLISGDAKKATANIAKKLGVDEFYAEISPNEKADIVAKLQEGNKVVAFVGDGINDISALKQADLSIAFNEENAIANAIADVSVLNKNIFSVYKIIKIVQNTRINIIWNLFWAFIYNVILIPLTVLGYVPPYIAAFAMMFSEIVIVTSTIIYKNHKIRIISKEIFKQLNNPDLQEKI